MIFKFRFNFLHTAYFKAHSLIMHELDFSFLALMFAKRSKHFLYCFFCLDLALELFNKCRLRQQILPLVNQQDFVLLYCGVLGHVDNKRTDSSEFYQKAKNNRKPRQHKTRTEITKGNVAPQEDPLTEVTDTETLPLYQNAGSVGGCQKVVRRKTAVPGVRQKLSKCDSVEGRLKAEDDGKQPKA